MEEQRASHPGRRRGHVDAGAAQMGIAFHHRRFGCQQKADVEGFWILRFGAAGQNEDESVPAPQDGHAVVAALLDERETEAGAKERGRRGDVKNLRKDRDD